MLDVNNEAGRDVRAPLGESLLTVGETEIAFCLRALVKTYDAGPARRVTRLSLAAGSERHSAVLLFLSCRIVFGPRRSRFSSAIALQGQHRVTVNCFTYVSFFTFPAAGPFVFRRQSADRARGHLALAEPTAR